MTTLHEVELGVLGPLQVRQYGLPVSIPGAKPRTILTMLGLHGGSVVSADTLVELLWGDDPPRTAAKALQTHISSLRRALGDGFVLTQGTGWTLSTTEIDAIRYKSAAKLGRAALAAGDVNQAVAGFDEALSLWRGIPELPESQRGVSEKTRWIEGHAAMVEDRAEALLATGRAAEIIGDLEAGIADAPLRERRWGQLMLALYRAGRQGEALAAYQRARSLLADQLGVDPGPDLRRLEAAIVAQDDTLELAVSQQLSTVTKAVTFLLTDIEGSTAAWEAQANAMAVALARHDEIVEQVVTSRGGRLIKTRGEGDATFSVFDRPSGAAAAAIELQEAIRHEPWALSEPMRIRVALHTGEVELRDGDYFGRAVNRAARLRSLAAGGQILCSGATAELVIDTLSDDVLLIDLGSRQLKNLARPEHVFELRLETTEDPASPKTEAAPIEQPDLPAVLAAPGPFVGRAPELERLLSAWQLTLDAGTRGVLIAGEPGVGKTRLSGEWARQAYEQGAVVLYGRCDEDLGAPYQPFAEALRSLVPCLGASRLRGLRGVEALLALVPGLADVLPDLTAPPRADADTERYALFDAVVALLGIASASAPVVLVLDDLHWAAKPTLLLLRHLLRFGEHARVQIVGTYRSTDLDRSHPLAAMLADLHRDGSANRLQLNGLDEDDVTAYVAEAGYDDEELARALASVTGGNPFFLIEALRHVDESGGHWDPSTLPQGVREAVSRRLSRLPAETNKALAAAAVVGSRFAIDLVERVVGEDLVDAFDEASKAGIVIEEPGGRYRFNHAIVRQSLLAELASVRRMRLHQRIAASLETEQSADGELLAELAYHYFECAWAGNAAKAVDYCRRAADQAMARLAYEGAADLYDKASHALDELDDELPDRADLQAELLVARCEALLAAGDVGSARGAVSQLQRAANDSARMAAWGTCFDSQLSMLTDPERLDEIETALGAAAEELAGLDDAAGQAKAHTVRAECLARLGRIGDCETALDQALTAARRAGEHRRVNAVLAGAPLAALWGPNPVPRAGGRCLDVVRLLRITTGSPVVEATSTRCQGVLDAFRGRAAAGRQLIDSARRSLTELGMRHALLEVDQFAGIVEMVADDPASAEPHLRRAYNGFRRMGLEADTAETAALLARACLTLGRDVEADELCTESEELAGHALKPSIAWRTVRAQLLARGGAHDEARRVAKEAVTWAERTDLLVDHGDACLALATVLGMAGDAAGARAAAEKAVSLYELKGAAALAEKAHQLLDAEVPAAPAPPEVPLLELKNACTRATGRFLAALNRGAWSEVEELSAPDMEVESRRKFITFTREDLFPGNWTQNLRRLSGESGINYRHDVVAVRGERLALIRLELATADASHGAPHSEMLQVVGLDQSGRIALGVWFDIEDIDVAMAELDAAQARFETQPSAPTTEAENACVRAVICLDAAIASGAWDEIEQLLASDASVESRRKIVGFPRVDLASIKQTREATRYREHFPERHRRVVVAVRGERLALTRVELRTSDESLGAPRDEMLQLFGLDEAGRVGRSVWFDIDDIDAAIAELDAAHARVEARQVRAPLENAASRAEKRLNALFAESRWDEIEAMLTDNVRVEERRRAIRRESDERATLIAEMRVIADLGVKNMASEVLATRGERLVLSLARFTGRDRRPDAFRTEILRIGEMGADGRMVGTVTFDLADFEAAIAELDARYLAGEGSAHAQTWSKVAEAYTTLNQQELPATTQDWVNVDHRRLAPVEAGHLAAYVRDAQSQWGVIFIEAVHRLTDVGAVLSRAIDATSRDGFEAEWREIDLLTFEGDRISRLEIFDEADLDAAIARFQELKPRTPKFENAASQAYERLNAHFSTGDWEAMSKAVAQNMVDDDRRRTVNAGVRYGRDIQIANGQAVAETGAAKMASSVIAIRGVRLALCRTSIFGSDPQPGAFRIEFFSVVEIDANEQLEAHVAFDLDDIDGAFEELDARYLAGEANPHAHTWSVIGRNVAAFNRGDRSTTTPDWITIDHRRVALFAPGELATAVRDSAAPAPEFRARNVAVHRLSDRGAIVTTSSHGTSPQGFEAEWKVIQILTVDGELISRCELFDETDLDAAIARFDELSCPAPQLDNAAIRVTERLRALFAARDWRGIPELYADDISADDRRRVIGGGPRSGRDAEVANLRAMADLGASQMDSTVLATRGTQLVLHRTHAAQDDSRFEASFLSITEINADGQIVRVVGFDVDNIDAAFEELDARYLAGEAAACANTWSALMRAYAAANRQELREITPDWATIDHRRARAFAPGEMREYMDATWKLAPNVTVYIEAVHRLTDFGAVVTHVAQGSSQQGFEAEWREIGLVTLDGDLFNRCELFDEVDLAAALARFDELSRPAPRLNNTASQVHERLRTHFAARDWDAMAEMLAADFSADDRRRVVGAGARHGRDAAIVDGRAIADLGLTYLTATVIATRGERLVLVRGHAGNDGQLKTLLWDLLQVAEIDAGGRITALVTFDPDDIDAAFEELDARYLAGEAAAHAQTWSVIAGGFAAVNKFEVPHLASDWVNIDHRRERSFAPGISGEMAANISALWDQAPDVRVYIEAVHRLTEFGAVFTQRAYGTSQNGFEAEWRAVNLEVVDGDLINRCELFDEKDLHAALARFVELSRPTPRLENAATRVNARLVANYVAGDWAAMANLMAGDLHSEDRRRVVNADLHGRNSVIESLRYVAGLGIPGATSITIATRGERLGLTRIRYAINNETPDAFHVDLLQIIAIDDHERIAAFVTFDPDDIGAAFEELESRYLAGEAAVHTHTWSVIAQALAAFNRHELPQFMPDWVNIDHRRARRFAPGDLTAYISATLDLAPDVNVYAETVLRLSDLGAVFTQMTSGTSQEGFDAEWWEIVLATVEGDLISRIEVFDEADLDAALARFDELTRPTPELHNAASRAIQRLNESFAERDWAAMADMLADDFHGCDRRHIVSIDLHGGDAVIESFRAAAEFGVPDAESIALAIRGERLVLTRVSYAVSDEEPDSFHVDLLQIVAIDVDERIEGLVTFDVDEFDAAIAELDARYLAGEAAPHARTWSVVAASAAAIGQHKLPPTTPNWINIDHRRASPFAPGDLAAIISTSRDITPRLGVYVEAVHRLSDLGVVVTSTTRGTSREGFEAEWRVVLLQTVYGDLMNRIELFDEADLDAAIATFDELSRPTRQLDNTANRILESYLSHFAARDWGLMAPSLAEDFTADDRRRTVNSGVRHGRDNEIANVKAIAEVGCSNITTTPVAIRGDRLVLARHSFIAPDWPDLDTETVDVVEIDADGQIVAEIAYDADDLDAAIAELDARYLAGEAAAHAHTWSVVAGAYAAVNRHDLPAWTADAVDVDHRSTTAVAPGELSAYLHATWGQTPDFRVDIVAVHRLSSFGALVTHVATGSTEQGFEGEWREITLSMIDGDRIKRSELFDEADLDAALARFDELASSATRLENTVSRVEARCQAYIAAGDWDAMAAALADDVFIDDRRRVVNAGFRRGRHAVMEDLRVGAEIGLTHITPSPIAIRGERLTLRHIRYSGGDQRPEAGVIELVQIVEIDPDERITALVLFEPDDIGAAFKELDARYLGGQAAAYAQTYSVIADAFAAVNQREFPSTTPDLASIDHRRPIAFAPGELIPYLQATLNDSPEIRIDVEAVHRLSNLGAVVSHAWHNTSQQGFDAEWRVISISTIDGDRINRTELFDEADLDAALARFDELSRPTAQLKNAASQVHERFNTCYTSGDWDGLAATMAEDFVADDRRRFVGTGGTLLGRNAAVDHARVTGDLGVRNAVSTVIAVRGQRLALMRARFWGRDELPDAFNAEVLHMVEIDERQQIATFIGFDLDDLEAAIAELDARYLAGEAAPNARTWSVITHAYAGMTRGEIPATTPDLVNVDHRHVAPMAPDDGIAYLRASWDLAQNFNLYIESVHRLSDLGAVFTRSSTATSRDGFDAEWRAIDVMTLDGDRINRGEIFDEADLEDALARFDELSRLVPELENAASQVAERFWVHFAANDRAVVCEIMDDDISIEDRRPVVNSGLRRGRDAVIDDMQIRVNSGVRQTRPSVIATRGAHLVLGRIAYTAEDERPDSFVIEIIFMIETDANDVVSALIVFDPDDIDSAFGELDSRYAVGEAAPHANTWSVIAQAFAALNRREVPATTPDWVRIDHRRIATFEADDWATFLHATWSLTPDVTTYVQTVHRLSRLGAVVTHAARGTSHQGFDAEWRMVDIFTVDSGLISRGELFDETDLDAALARFDDLSRPGPRLENAASRLIARFQELLGTRDWDGMAELFADGICLHDRRPLVGVEFFGRDATIANMQASADTGVKNVTSTVIATRGSRVALHRVLINGRDQRPEAFRTDALVITEVDGADRIIAFAMFDLNEIDAAFAELDARYLAGEAADHARTWSVIADVFSTYNREGRVNDDDWVSIDHRRGYPADKLTTTIRAARDLTPDLSIYIEAVHRLSDRAAVITNTSFGTSHEGFAAEWRMVQLMTVDGDHVTHLEIFDESDIDVALAKFDELTGPAQHLNNAASQVVKGIRTLFAARDWSGMRGNLAENFLLEDRRRTVNGGVSHGRDTTILDLRAAVDVGFTDLAEDIVALRGERLVLTRARYSGNESRPDPYFAEVLHILEIDADQKLAATIVFDPEDIDAAFDELDARFIVREAAAHARTWSLISQAYAALNRHEIPPTTPDWVNVDHRHAAAFDDGGFFAFVRAAWDVAPNMHRSIEVVHRLSNLGAVVSHAAHGTSQAGFEAEWRNVVVVTVDGDLINHLELFDEEDLDTAITRFDELSRRNSELENAASRAYDRFKSRFAACEWGAISDMLTDDHCSDDRRPVVGAGIRHGREAEIQDLQGVAAAFASMTMTSVVVAIRGERLALCRCHFSGHDQQADALHWDLLGIIEVDADERIAAFVTFEPDDIEAALEELDSRYLAGEAAAHARRAHQLENTATRNWTRLADAFHRRDEDAFVGLLEPNGQLDDRRKGLRVSLDGSARRRAVQSLFEFPQSWRMELEHVAVRGSRLSLSRQFYRESDQTDRPITIEVLTLTECSDGGLVHTLVLFDADDFDAATAELDARYIAGEGAAHAHIWTLVNQTYARFNLHELSPTTPDWVNVDHRRGAAPEPGDMHAYVSAMWAVAPDVRTCIESVHRLTNLGAVFTHSELGTSQQGFGAEWREVTLLTFEGDLIDRCELFDEDALDVAIARLDELTAQVNHLEGAATQLDNAATRVRTRIADEFNRRDISAFLALAAPNGSFEDRRKGLRDEATGEGLIKVTEALFEIVPTDWAFEVKPLALRGSRLALTLDRYRTTDKDPTTTAEHLTLTEIDDDDLVRKTTLFDPDDIDAAFEELDARYVAGEAAAYAQTWSLTMQTFVGFNCRDLAATTPDWVNIDHRRGIPFAPGDMISYITALWDVAPDAKYFISSVHRLNNRGAVITAAGRGTSQQEFDAEWREIYLLTFEDNQINRCELFDETNIDAALARFDELNTSAQALENAATRVSAALADAFNRRDLDDLIAAYGTNAQYDDRRKGLRNVGLLSRDFGHGLFEFEATSNWRLDIEPVGIRGKHLALIRHTYRDTVEADQPITVEALLLTEADDDDGSIAHSVLFDPDDIDSAFEELDARYLAGEAAPYAGVWSDVVRVCMKFNRREMPPATTEFVSIDHRRGTAFAPGELTEYLQATWDLSPTADLYIEEVRRLTDRGAVVTFAGNATSRDGFAAEWRVINVFVFEGHLLTRVEIFDETDLDMALGRFDELNTLPPPLENDAARNHVLGAGAFNRRDLEGFLALHDADARYDDRRHGLRSEGAVTPNFVRSLLSVAPAGFQLEFEVVAIRGDRLGLFRDMFRDTYEVGRPIAVETVTLNELNDDGLISRIVTFDPDDVDAAFAELTARWIASGEVAHPAVIKSMQNLFEATNRQEWDALAAIEADATFVNHRQLASGDEIVDHWSSLRTLALLIPDLKIVTAEFITHSATGVLASIVISGTTTEGAAIELPAVVIVFFDGPRVTRIEAFDADRRDHALARFEELCS